MTAGESRGRVKIDVKKNRVRSELTLRKELKRGELNKSNPKIGLIDIHCKEKGFTFAQIKRSWHEDLLHSIKGCSGCQERRESRRWRRQKMPQEGLERQWEKK